MSCHRLALAASLVLVACAPKATSQVPVLTSAASPGTAATPAASPTPTAAPTLAPGDQASVTLDGKVYKATEAPHTRNVASDGLIIDIVLNQPDAYELHLRLASDKAGDASLPEGFNKSNLEPGRMQVEFYPAKPNAAPLSGSSTSTVGGSFKNAGAEAAAFAALTLIKTGEGRLSGNLDTVTLTNPNDGKTHLVAASWDLPFPSR